MPPPAARPAALAVLPAALAAAVVVLLCLLLVAQVWAGSTLSRRLSSRGWTLHSRPNCPDCTRQNAALGDPFYQPQVVHQEWPPEKRRLPYWINAKTGEDRQGPLERSELRAMAA